MDQIALLEGLREHYPETNPIRLLLDELIKDLREETSREEILKDAEDLLKSLDPTSTAYKLISQFV